MSMGCNSYQCPANSNYHYGDADGLGVCYKSSTSPELLDEYAQHCGFICVTDSWTVWKFGVPFKELTCGNCHNYAPGEYSHGECTTDKDFGYLNDSRRYQGAHACKEFKKKEGGNLAKKTYWTKCGIEFQKSTNADVTGYIVDEANETCAACPFIIDVTEGWGDNKKHKRWECRAGSEKPKHKTEWVGSLDDKNTISINSLDHKLMEEIRQYCKQQPDISASYNTDHMADCRRTLSISCSQNKKGIAAKKELIEKFFPVKGADLHEVEEVKEDCTTCMFATDSDKSGKVKCSEHPKDGDFKSTEDCPQYTPAGGNSVNIYIDDPNWDDKWSGDSNEKEYPNCNSSLPVTAQDGCPFNDSDGRCLFGEETHDDEFTADVARAVKEFGCKSENVIFLFNIGKLGVEPNITIQDQGSLKVEKELDPNRCPYGKLSCDCRCIQWGGACDVIRRKDWDRYHFVKEFEKYNIDCDIFRKLAAEIIAEKKPEKVNDIPKNDTQPSEPVRPDINRNDHCCGNCSHYSGDNNTNYHCGKLSAYKDNYGVPLPHAQGCSDFNDKWAENANDLAEIDTKPSETVNFDYSTVDEQTAEFLQEKASKITEIRLKSVLAIGKELKEAQDKLANNKNGTFGAWTSSIGISRQTAYNYINGYEFIVKNFDNIEAAEDLSPSLLFAAAKKDAPQELTQQVVSGDITSLKEYKALEDKLKAAEKRADDAEFHYQTVSKSYDRLEKVNTKHYDDSVSAQTQISLLQKQLDQAKRNSDPAKVKDLGNIIFEKQQEIENLKKQLKDKPIEVPATKVVIPDAVRLAIYEKVSRLYEGLCKLTETEIQIFADDVSEDYRDDVIKGTEDAMEVLAKIASAVWELTE